MCLYGTIILPKVRMEKLKYMRIPFLVLNILILIFRIFPSRVNKPAQQIWANAIIPVFFFLDYNMLLILLCEFFFLRSLNTLCM